MRRVVKYRPPTPLSLYPPFPLVLPLWQEPLQKESRGGGLPRSAPRWAPSCWVQHHGERHCVGCCVCVCTSVCAYVRVCVLTAHQVSSQYEFLRKQEPSGKHKPC